MKNLIYFLIPISFVLSIVACTSTPLEEDQTVTILLETDTTQAVLFAEGVISTNLNERDFALSPDGKELFFTLNNLNNSLRALVHCVQQDGRWTSPEVVSFSGTYKDIEPFFSPDGQRLYFASTRPIEGDEEKRDYDLWYSEKTASGWGSPVHLGAPVNTDGNEFYPAVAQNGNLYFTTSDASGNEDIYLSTWDGHAYSAPSPLDSNINTPTYEFNAYISPGEDVLVFSSYGREDGLGGGDLYFSRKDKNGQWLKAQHLGEAINSNSLDYCPFVDWEREIFYFSSNRGAENLGSSSYQMLEEASLGTLNGLGNLFYLSLPSVLKE